MCQCKGSAVFSLLFLCKTLWINCLHFLEEKLFFAVFSHAPLSISSKTLFLHPLFSQPGFLPSDIAMPSPDAMSPSGLKSGSQFYPSYPNNPRRRPPDGGIGEITGQDMGHVVGPVISLFLCFYFLILLTRVDDSFDLPIIFFINQQIVWSLECQKIEKSFSQFAWAQGDVFKLFKLFSLPTKGPKSNYIYFYG